MNFSSVQYVADGVTQSYAITFDYLDEDHVKVLVDGVEVGFTFSSPTVALLDAVPDSGSFVLVKRETPRDERFVTFVNRSIQSANDFNLDSNQLFYINQEALDSAGFGLQRFPGTGDVNTMFTDINMNGYTLKNLAAPVDSADPVRLSDVQTIVESEIDVYDFAPVIADYFASNPIPSASETEEGLIEIASSSEVSDGTDDTKAVTPLTLQEKIDAIPASGVAIGTIVTGIENPDPSNYLECDGSEVDINTYTDLYTFLDQDLYGNYGNTFQNLITYSDNGLPAYMVQSATDSRVGRFGGQTLVAQKNGLIFYTNSPTGPWTQNPDSAYTNTGNVINFETNASLIATKGYIGTMVETSIIYSSDGINWTQVDLGKPILGLKSNGVEFFILFSDEIRKTDDFAVFDSISMGGVVGPSVESDFVIEDEFSERVYFNPFNESVVPYVGRSGNGFVTKLKDSELLNGDEFLAGEQDVYAYSSEYNPYTRSIVNVHNTSESTFWRVDYKFDGSVDYLYAGTTNVADVSPAPANVKWIGSDCFVVAQENGFLYTGSGFKENTTSPQAINVDGCSTLFVDKSGSGVNVLVGGDGLNAGEAPLTEFVFALDSKKLPDIKGDGIKYFIKATNN